MFSKELENLIQATLEDGMLEENEKTALVKRAQAEGVDIAELEIYINSLLQRRQRELKEKKNALEEKSEQEKKMAIGPVCPKCGKQVPPLTLKCDCGYEFTTQKQVSSVQLLSERILQAQSNGGIGGFMDTFIKSPFDINNVLKGSYSKNEINQNIVNIITVFPVPNTKEDIVEFLALAAPNSIKKGGLWGTRFGRIVLILIAVALLFIIPFIIEGKEGLETGGPLAGMTIMFGLPLCLLLDQDTIRYNQRADAWRAKFKQVLMKGRSLRGDSEFQQQLDYYENLLNKK